MTAFEREGKKVERHKKVSATVLNSVNSRFKKYL